jgi:hypothetical protein
MEAETMTPEHAGKVVRLAARRMAPTRPSLQQEALEAIEAAGDEEDDFQ